MKRMVAISSVMVMLLALMGCASQDRIDEQQQTIQELENTVESLRSENTRLESKLEKEKEERKRLERLRRENEKLQDQLSDIKETTSRREGQYVVLSLPEKILFERGEAALQSKARTALDKLADVLEEHPDRAVMVQGHTDTIPIRGGRFSSNWELSSSRAASVVEYLSDKSGIKPGRLIAAGYGEHHPVAPNDTEENQRLNRRVEIVLFPPSLPEEQMQLTGGTGDTKAVGDTGDTGS